eukprot:6619580-Pyramimonas_sp.AAC.1
MGSFNWEELPGPGDCRDAPIPGQAKCYAVPTGRSAGGTTGGETVLARKSAAATTFDAMRKHSRQWCAVDPCHGFAPMTWHRKTGDLV